jgi:hypothetical protein
MKYNKKYLFNSDEKDDFVYEIEEGFTYMSKDKNTIYFVGIETDDECDGYAEFDEIEFKESKDSPDDEGNTEAYAIRYSMTIKEFEKLVEKVMGCKNE